MVTAAAPPALALVVPPSRGTDGAATGPAGGSGRTQALPGGEGSARRLPGGLSELRPLAAAERRPEPVKGSVIMDITRGSLDKISRPASSSKAYPHCRTLNTSMELLTPEPCFPKVDSPLSLAGSYQRSNLEDCCPEENKGDDREKSDVKEVRTDQETTVEGYMSSSDSGDDNTETQTLKFCEPSKGKLHNAKAANSSNLEHFEETDADPQIQAAIKKMNKLDTILAKKRFKERAIKKQGKEMRAKLWEELQSIRTTGSHEEIENTKLFLALISSRQYKADTSHSKEDETCTSVFHTQINPEDYDCHETQHNQDYPNELEMNEFLNQAEKMQSKSKSNQDFIKKNIELAKDSGNQIVMLEGERKRLIELLKDTEDGIELQSLKENVSGWLAPGEGYTPEPMEFHHLSEIDIKLQVLLSDEDFSVISSSCSKTPSQIYQESLAYANRNLEAVPGEKVLRDNKEQRDQQNRLKEIDHQLKSLERNLSYKAAYTEEKVGKKHKTLIETEKFQLDLKKIKATSEGWNGMEVARRDWKSPSLKILQTCLDKAIRNVSPVRIESDSDSSITAVI